jgi:Xaa-Pro aminopeptidase
VSDRRPARLAALVDAMQQAHLDALLLTGLANIRYVTGFGGSSALAVVTRRGEVLLVTDFRYQTQVADEVGDFARVVIEQSSLWAGLWQQLAGVRLRGGRRLRERALLHRDFQRLLDAGARWGWRPTADLVEGLRERKDAARWRASGRGGRGGRALERTLAEVRPGSPSWPVAGRSSATCARAGARGSRSRPSSPAARARRSPTPARRSGRSPAATCCSSTSAPVVGGYCADVTRTVVVGRADARQREIHDVVRSANELAAARVRAGMTGKDADALARDYIAARGTASCSATRSATASGSRCTRRRAWRAPRRRCSRRARW